ncbi:MAG TPA: bis(5'-nucleosyl)-tetraphosphatase (symmetrical) YqeK [Anaerolineae bacterium]|jgi:predicted HD superfamily hydrolase involved in NAD metabolism
MMHPKLLPYFGVCLYTGDVRADMVGVFQEHGFLNAIAHATRVGAEARRLAVRYGADAHDAEVAGWLHDISAVVPNAERVELASQLGIDVLPEETRLPMIVHQKLSAAIARDVFEVKDPAILAAIGCHTTLKVSSSLLDQVVFVADKLKWDQPGDPPYLVELNAALAGGIDYAVWCYLRYLWERRSQLAVVHPWFAQAYAEWARRFGST